MHRGRRGSSQTREPARRGRARRITLGRSQHQHQLRLLRLEATTNAPLMFFGVAEVGKAAPILERAAAAAARSYGLLERSGDARANFRYNQNGASP